MFHLLGFRQQARLHYRATVPEPRASPRCHDNEPAYRQQSQDAPERDHRCRMPRTARVLRGQSGAEEATLPAAFLWWVYYWLVD